MWQFFLIHDTKTTNKAMSSYTKVYRNTGLLTKYCLSHAWVNTSPVISSTHTRRGEHATFLSNFIINKDFFISLTDQMPDSGYFWAQIRLRDERFLNTFVTFHLSLRCFLPFYAPPQNSLTVPFTHLQYSLVAGVFFPPAIALTLLAGLRERKELDTKFKVHGARRKIRLLPSGFCRQ